MEMGRFSIWLVIAILGLFAVPSSAYAVQTLSGSQVTISSPIDDDVFASGGTVDINSPVSGLVVTGGTININAPISGDVFASGGQIFVNSNVGGKIVAVGGKIDLEGSAKNIVLWGGTVNIHPSSVISKDALIGGSNVNNAGTIRGNLTVMAQNFVNTGTAGNVSIKQADIFKEVRQATTILEIIIFGGFFILGLILIKYFPSQFMQVEERVRRSMPRTALVGFVAIIVSSVVIILTAITIIGLPIAAIMGMLFVIALMLSTLFVSFTVGKKIVDRINLKTNNYGIYAIGFVVLYLLFKIPYAGSIILAVAVSLGFGAIYYTVRNSCKTMTPSAS